RDRVRFLRRSVFQRLAMPANTVMNVGHEVVEMRPSLRARWNELEEHVHQHGLAAADVAVDVEASNRFAWFLSLAEKPPKRARLARHPLFLDAVDQRVQFPDDLLLRRIACDGACFDKVCISLRNSKM